MSVMQNAKTLIGHLLRHVRSSNEKLAGAQAGNTAHGELSITSDAFQPNMPIPTQYTQYGSNISPALKWSGIPAQAKELVLVLEDPDAPMPHPLAHWIIYQIPPSTRGLPERIPQGKTVGSVQGAIQAPNYGKREGYDGPKPPPGHGVHHYHFQLFAVDTPLNLKDQPTKDDLVKAMQGHVIAQGELVGTFEKTS